jgi:two-component system CheB/CheR fusion protein
MANDAARRMFGLGVGDYGRPVQDLELSYRPIELRGHLDAVARDLRGAEIKAVRWRSADTERILDIRVTPLLGDSALLGTSIAYTDVTEAHHLQEQLAGSRRDLEQAYEELQSTVEELETTNEELQSTNEELETTNEELQSTNEELETMNEELQSSNEELETMNEELRHRTAELHELNAFLEAIHSRIGMAVAVIDRSQHVQVWNGKARELFGVSTEEAEDQHVMSLDIGLPLVELRSRITAALGGRSEREEVTVEAVNRRGKPFQCRVTLLPLGPQRDDGYGGLIMMMEPVGEAPSR